MSNNFSFFVKKSVEEEGKPYRVLRYALLYAKKNDMTVYDENNNVLYTGDAVAEKLADMQRKTAEKMLRKAEEAERALNKKNVQAQTPVQKVEIANANNNVYEKKVLENVVQPPKNNQVKVKPAPQEEDTEVEIPKELFDLIMAFEAKNAENEEDVVFASDEDIDNIFGTDDAKEEKVEEVVEEKKEKKSIIKKFVDFIKGKKSR